MNCFLDRIDEHINLAYAGSTKSNDVACFKVALQETLPSVFLLCLKELDNKITVLGNKIKYSKWKMREGYDKGYLGALEDVEGLIKFFFGGEKN